MLCLPDFWQQRENGWVTSARVTFSYSPAGKGLTREAKLLSISDPFPSRRNSHASPSGSLRDSGRVSRDIVFNTIWSELARGVHMKLTLTGHETKTRSMMDGIPV